MSKRATLGIIGGSGLYQMEGLSEVEEVRVPTPFGEPSDSIFLGTLKGARVAFLPRHGRGHRLMPSEIPVKANIYALKSLGVERVISVSAVGSLKEEIRPLELVIPDQLIDHSRGREGTFFGQGIVAHVGFAEPFCPVLSDILFRMALELGVPVHRGGTYLVIEGPAFSTRAESLLYRSWGASIIGMTALPEARLAREAEICYSILAFVTDYDCWYQGYETVSVEMVVQNLERNRNTAQRLIQAVVPYIPATRECPCGSALKGAIITARDQIPEGVRKELSLLIQRYIEP